MNTSSTGAPDGERFISPRIAASPLRFLLLAVALGSGAHTTLSAESSRFGVRAVPGTCGWYRVLPTVHREAAPIQSVRLGVSQDAETIVYTLDLCRTQATGPDLVSVQIRLILETSSNPPATPDWLRYQVWIPASGETYDYRNVHTDRALLPGWDRFDEQFLPQPTRNTRYQEGFPETMRLLGHVLSLRRVEKLSDPPAAPEPKILHLDPELLIATGRTFRDTEGHCLPQDRGENEYHYTPWTKTDYETMIQAGFNLFLLVPGIESWLRAQPVFYLRGMKGDAALEWPVDFYRSNYQGASMFADEPACVMLRDKEISDGMLHFSDAAEIIKLRARHEYEDASRHLGEALRRSGISLGALELRQTDVPVWETRYETVFYQLEAGFAGFVHEGRYHLERFYESTNRFDQFVHWATGLHRKHTAREMLAIHFATLRGAARHVGKDWGTSLYGQADPAIAPMVFPMAYDMGARYFWFWTSGHAHHMPWPEQLQLARAVRDHARTHARSSIRSERPTLDQVILIPYGYFLVPESPMNRRHDWDLWWIRDLDRTGQNAASQRYRRLLRAAFDQIHAAFDNGKSFDIAVDDGRTPQGYRTVIRLTDSD